MILVAPPTTNKVPYKSHIVVMESTSWGLEYPTSPLIRVIFNYRRLSDGFRCKLQIMRSKPDPAC